MNKRNVRKFFKRSVLLMAIISIYVFPGQVKAAGAESGEEISIVTRQEELWTESQIVRVDYADLWKSNAITAKKGQAFRLYVDVPEDTTPRGCGGTVKIPGYEKWTDEYNKEQNHIVLKEGTNFIYEFPAFDEPGDIQFTCWMGSGCHYNYIHVTEDGTYNGTAPEAPTDIQVARNGAEATVSFKAPEISKEVTITGYVVTATATDGSGRKRANGTESPITVTELDPEKTYTYTIIAHSTAGRGVVSEAVQEPEKEQGTEEVKTPEKEQKSEEVKKTEKKDSGEKKETVKNESGLKTPAYEKVTSKATLDKDGSIVEKDKNTGKVNSSVTISHPAAFVFDQAEYVYDGKEKKPTVIVTAADGKKIASENYTVTYESNKSVGTAVAKVVFKGNYSGTKELSFTIAPKGTTISSLTKAQKGFAVKWKKQTTEITGYQIQYSTKKTFTSDKKLVTVSKKSTKTKKIGKLKAKKKYYVRIRTYKKVNEKTFYSSWSKAKTVKTK